MNYQIIAPATYTTEIELPASKSLSNRALIINALSDSPYPIENISDCDDTRVMLKAFASGANRIDIGAAGTSMRFMTAFLSLINRDWYITGTERMKERPISVLVDALRMLGANITYAEEPGYPPLNITGGPLEGGDITLQGDVSSQYISALLMIAPYMKKGLTITLEGDVISKPYISMTLKLMSFFGVHSTWNENIIEIIPQKYEPLPFRVENDWTAASYWYEIAALSDGADIVLPELVRDSMQGDSKIASLFVDLGVDTEYTRQGIKISKHGAVCTKKECNLANQPDLAQTLVVTCALLDIPFSFSGLQSLRIKETDRISAMIKEMAKLGYVITENSNVLEWNGERCEPLEKIAIDTYKDHRMAMAFAPAAIRFPGLTINDFEVVTKSYPGYWADLKKAGFSITENLY